MCHCLDKWDLTLYHTVQTFIDPEANACNLIDFDYNCMVFNAVFNSILVKSRRQVHLPMSSVGTRMWYSCLIVLVKPRKDMNNVRCRRDMTEILLKAE